MSNIIAQLELKSEIGTYKDLDGQRRELWVPVARGTRQQMEARGAALQTRVLNPEPGHQATARISYVKA